PLPLQAHQVRPVRARRGSLMQELVIDLDPDPKPGKKTRAFRATMLASIEADLVANTESNKRTSRPVWLVLAGLETELRPFVANLRLGRRAKVGWHGGVETPRAVNYRFTWNRSPEGASVTVCVPDL